MSITLNSTLKAAQDGQSHHIILDIVSEPIIADIPFVGYLLTDETTNEHEPNVIMHSSGRLNLIYTFGTNSFKFVYTDLERTQFYFVTINYSDIGMGIAETALEASICELSDGNIGMIFISCTVSNYYLKRVILTNIGSIQSYATIASYSRSSVYEINSPFVIRLLNDSYLLAYLKGSQLQPTSSGTYTGTNNGEYIVAITTDGDNTTAKFKWKKDNGGWSGEITCTGSPQLLAEGVYITFVPGNYLIGMYFYISVTSAKKAVGYISIVSNALNDDQIIIGSQTYTYKTSLPGGGNPNEIIIDILGIEISLENLNCAINDSSFEGTGEGVRYGNGTAEHPDVESSRGNYTLTIRAKVAGAAGNSITITVPSGRFYASSMSGGANSSIGEVRTEMSSVIKKRTSNDFITWSAEMDLKPGGVIAQKKTNLSLYQLSSGDIWVMFDNFDDPLWSNCYYAVSTDNGITWGNAVALTNYDSPLAGGRHPVLVQKSETSVYAVFFERRGALHIDSDSVGWPGGSSSITGVHVYSGKIYAVATYTSYGTKFFIAVVEIDLATWRITNAWNTTSIPAFHAVFADVNVWWGCNRSGGKYVVIGTLNEPQIGVLNIDTNTITHYHFYDKPAYGIIKNVNWIYSNPTYSSRSLVASFIDEDNDRLYLVLAHNHAFHREIDIVYIDLTEELVPGSTYNVTTVYNSINYFTEVQLTGLRSGDFKVYPDIYLAILSSSPTIGAGNLTMFSIDDVTEDWTVYKHYTGNDGSDFPYYGILNFIYYNGYIYGTFEYYTNQPNKKGLCRINVEADPDFAFTFIIPVWPVQYNDYNLYDLVVTNDGTIIISSYSYGITLYDTGTGEWTLYDNDSVIGLTPNGKDIFNAITYDESTGMIIAGTWYNDWCGVTAFNRYGTMFLPKYRIGTYTVDWSFSAANDFVVGLLDSQTVVTLDPDDNGIYAFWVKRAATTSELSIKWAKETPSFNLMPYVIKQVPIVITRSIETNKPNTITFAVSHGHLFDPFNDLSLWRGYVAKGNKLVIRMGEKIGGIDYWQAMGTFLITERSMITYERGKYPVMEIKAEDKRLLWADKEILVSTNYEQKNPEYIMGHLIENEGEEDITDIDIPSFDNSTILFHQWTDTDLLTIIEQICNRYGYFFKITVNDKCTCSKISDSNSITHIYTATEKIITYTPDDTFSDHTNKIIVACEGRDTVQRIFPQERVLFLTGTMGWWGQKKDRKEYYNENREKQVMNPLIKKLETTEGIMFELAGKVKESIAEIDPDNKYVVVRIEAPDLRPALIAAISIYIGAGSIPGFIGDMSKTAAFVLIVNILASIANYQFEIWGNPVGYVRQSWQATAEDTDLQALIGKTIEKKIDEPLAYYINEAQDVANHEMLILKLQRRRIKIKKIAHIQDEEGDTIQIKHPYSARDKKIFITNLTRSLKLSETSEGDGYFFDEIDGWLL